jgi:hypothetical protein
MTDWLAFPVAIVVPAVLGLYALAFVAGGIYYLEQQVARLRDLFPGYGPLARLLGWTALGIGILAAISVAGHLLSQDAEFGYGALVAAGSGVGFWVVRIHFDPTRTSRVRAVLLALLCALVTLLTAWWTTTV